jgi:hypothetical protein
MAARKSLAALAWGLLPGAAALGVGAWALTPDGIPMLVSSGVLSVTWWTVVPFGMVIATTVSRRMWPGIVVGLADGVMFHTLIAISRPAGERMAAFLSPSYLVAGLGTMSLPIVIGVVLGWASIYRERVRYDGVPGPDRS